MNKHTKKIGDKLRAMFRSVAPLDAELSHVDRKRWSDYCDRMDTAFAHLMARKASLPWLAVACDDLACNAPTPEVSEAWREMARTVRGSLS